jgi:TetR/AcrR family transcriptional regulator, regulator of autoinduction and epiphytic fitness
VTESHRPSHISRRERARATRLRILTNAHSLFLEKGYAATTMEEIASAAGVAVQTVYYTFRTKSLLLRDVVESAGAGAPDEPPVAERTWMKEALTEPSGDRALAVAIEHGVDIYVRAVPLWPAVRAASMADPEIEIYLESVVANRRAGMGQLVRHLDEIGYLQPPMTLKRGTDIVCTIVSHETYLALTRDSDWTIEECKAWMWATLRQQLGGASEPSPSALRGLSFGAVEWQSGT